MRPEFTDEEAFVIAYYKHAKLSSPSRTLLLDIAVMGVAVLFVGGSFFSGDPLWGMIGFVLLVVQQCRFTAAALKYGDVYRRIFIKYEECLNQVVESKKGELGDRT